MRETQGIPCRPAEIDTRAATWATSAVEGARPPGARPCWCASKSCARGDTLMRMSPDARYHQMTEAKMVAFRMSGTDTLPWSQDRVRMSPGNRGSR